MTPDQNENQNISGTFMTSEGGCHVASACHRALGAARTDSAPGTFRPGQRGCPAVRRARSGRRASAGRACDGRPARSRRRRRRRRRWRRRRPVRSRNCRPPARAGVVVRDTSGPVCARVAPVRPRSGSRPLCRSRRRDDPVGVLRRRATSPRPRRGRGRDFPPLDDGVAPSAIGGRKLGSDRPGRQAMATRHRGRRFRPANGGRDPMAGHAPALIPAARAGCGTSTLVHRTLALPRWRMRRIHSGSL